MKTNLILIGGGVVINEIKWLIEDINKFDDKINLLGAVDDFKKDGVLGDCSWLIKNKKKLEEKYGKIFLSCIVGTPRFRKEYCQKLEKHFSFINLIHPSAKIHSTVRLGKGLIICSGVTISPNAEIEDYIFLNFDVLAAHDVKIGKYSFCSPKTNIMGQVSIGEGNFFGASSVIIPRIKIGNNNIVGAGAVIINDFGDNNTICGVPAKVVHENENKN